MSKIKPFRKGDKLTAEWMEALRKEVLRTVRVAAPLQLTSNASGIYISWAGDNQRNKLIAKAEDGIPARDGDTPGKAEVTLYEIEDPEADEPVLVPVEDDEGNPRKIDAYNLASADVAEDAYLMLAYGSGVWWVDFEDCSED